MEKDLPVFLTKAAELAKDPLCIDAINFYSSWMQASWKLNPNKKVFFSFFPMRTLIYCLKTSMSFCNHLLKFRLGSHCRGDFRSIRARGPHLYFGKGEYFDCRL